MAKSRKPGTSGQRESTTDAVEHRRTPVRNELLGQEEKSKILLPSVLNEGHARIDATLQVGMSVLQKNDGTLGCVDVAFNRATSRDGGRTWGDYEKIDDIVRRKEEEGMQAIGFGWIRLPSGRIGMGWNEYGELPGRHAWVKTWWRLSEDEGETWSEDILINPTGEPGMPYHGEPLRLTSSGRLVVPARTCVSGGKHLRAGEHARSPEFDISYVYYSDDEGRTWSRCEGMVLGWMYDGWGNMAPTDEPGVDELADGRLMMLARSWVGRLLQSFSEDGGEHWSMVEPSPLASSYSPCALKRIPSTGDLLCVWNQVSANEIRQGKRRCRLSAAITSDGKTWKHFRTLERFTRMSEADRIELDELLIMCRSLDDIEFPADFGCADYPTIAFHEDDVIVSYARVHGVGEELVSAMKIRVLPLEWFYAAP